MLEGKRNEKKFDEKGIGSETGKKPRVKWLDTYDKDRAPSEPWNPSNQPHVKSEKV